MSAGCVVPELLVEVLGIGTARTVVMRSVQPGTTPVVVALGTVVWLPAKARKLYWRRIGSGASLTMTFSLIRLLRSRREYHFVLELGWMRLLLLALGALD